ncbi:ribosome biogenesis protein SSF1/2, partial [Phenoliferia sp. Uapishka_3]
MPTSLLDLSDDLLLMICEQVQDAQGYFSDQDDLRRLQLVNKRLRLAALPSLWERVHLISSTDAYDTVTSTIKILSLNSHLWLLVKHLAVWIDEIPGTSIVVALAVTLARNLRGMTLVSDDVDSRSTGSSEITTIVTNALRSSRIEEIIFQEECSFEDKTFSCKDIPTLRNAELSGTALSGQLFGDVPGETVLNRIGVRMVDGSAGRALLLRALRGGVAHLSLEGSRESEGAGNLWTQEFFDLVKETSTVETASEHHLTSLSFTRFHGFFQKPDVVVEPPSATIFDFLGTIPLKTLALHHYGNFYWTEAFSRIQLVTVTDLSLGAPMSYAYNRTRSFVDEVSARQSLRHFLASFPKLKVLELQGWVSSYDLQTFSEATDLEIGVNTPCLHSLLLLVGASSVQTLRLSRPGTKEAVLCNKERKSNRLRDFVAMSGPLGVTHLLVFSQPVQPGLLPEPSTSTSSSSKKPLSGSNIQQEEDPEKTTVNLRLIRLPRGPTLSFKVLRYSLASDVLRMARRPRSIGREFAEGPLLILSGFGGENKELGLMKTVFQNLFPAIHVQTMPLSSARRVVLLSYSPITKTVEWRHYLISVRPVGVSKPIRKIIAGSTSAAASLKRSRADDSASEAEIDDEENGSSRAVEKTGSKGKAVLDLSRADDISDYILRHEGMGYLTSDSEMSDASSAASGGSSDDERRGKVRLGADYIGRGNRGRGIKGEKRAVRLVELGPRIELGLVKVEEGVGEGEVLFHEIVHKSANEAAQLAKVHAARRKLQKERREAQAANVAAKKAAKALANGEAPEGEDAEGEDDEEEDEEDKIDSDIEYDYDEHHGLPVGDLDEEASMDDDSDFGSDEEGSGEEGEGAIESDADDSDEDEEEDEEMIGEYSDSDTSPVPIGYDEREEQAPPPKKKPKVVQGRKQGPMSFKHSAFSKQERAPAKGAIGIQLPRPSKEKKDPKEDGGDGEGGGRG